MADDLDTGGSTVDPLESPFDLKDGTMEPDILKALTGQFFTAAQHVASQQIAHTEQASERYSQQGTSQAGLLNAVGATIITGVTNTQANAIQALKAGGQFPTVTPITPTPVVAAPG